MLGKIERKDYFQQANRFWKKRKLYWKETEKKGIVRRMEWNDTKKNKREEQQRNPSDKNGIFPMTFYNS